jgi:single-strand DNA-binding protein
MAKRGVNKVILVGNLGNVPDYIEGANGGKLNFSIATSESWKDKLTQEHREKTEWHRLVAYQKLAELMHSFNLAKGTQLWIEGQLQTRKWTDASGNDRWTTEVVVKDFQVLGGRSDNAPRGGQPAQEQGNPAKQEPAKQASADQSPIPQPTPTPADGDIDDIPF